MGSWKAFLQSSGGKKDMEKEESIGAYGSICAVPKMKGVWDSEVWLNFSNAILYFGEANLHDYKAAEFINNNERKWNRELIINTFPEEAAGKILSIPLAEEPHEDFQNNKVKFVKEVQKWKPPPGQAIKINFDGAFDERNQQSASGIVARNSKGLVLLSSTKTHLGVTSAFAAEALACRTATEIRSQHARKGSIIKRCNARGEDKSKIGAYIHDIHQLISRSGNIKFEYTPRSANSLAHILAKESLIRQEEVYLVESVPIYAENQRKNNMEREPD
ncbi:uncharacterized protein LOC108472047 [Gossypium arboreum]|uniref:uncharacterized protein LOC108472047 n=1 Tax=Gossypium arboreum TaxID=29729 RepID=UPI000819742E|nr:uncharacterized protein LOC108472047 [Gossypium arboreum]